MSITYDGLREVQELRQSKFSQALRKSSLERVPTQKIDPVRSPNIKNQNLQWLLLSVIPLILLIGFAAFFVLRSSPPKTVKPSIKVMTRTPLVHKIIHHRILKKKKVFSAYQ
jgi:hypothetical protein